MYCTDITPHEWYSFSDQVPHLLYYSHIPTVIATLFFAFFIFIKSRTLVSQMFLFLAITFSCWTAINYYTWVGFDSSKIMGFWSLLGGFEVMLYALVTYFVYVFVDGKDIKLILKIIMFVAVIGAFVFGVSQFGLISFAMDTCEAIENYYYLAYIFGVENFFILWIFAIMINRFFKAPTIERKKIFLLSMGVGVFLISFFLAGVIAQLMYFRGYENAYSVEFYGLFGMVGFIAILAYLIVQYGAMDIKLARAQALVWAMIFLIGAQFFFIRNPTNMVLNAITLVLVSFVGYGVVKSVKREEIQNDRLMHYSKELARANAELKRLDSAKSEFISIASHQLRTPLTAIKGYISLILEGAYGQNPDRTDDALNKIFLANERLIQLVEDMLNLTRIESGRLEYHLEENVHVEEILNELKDMFILRAQDKKLEFVIDTSDVQLPPVRADKSKLREVISNLIDNAIKYTKEGFVHVSARKMEGVVRIVIEDSGMGISEESLKTLFAKFSRGTDSTKVYTDGSGLGLYVGKNLIESQGGHIYAESDGVNKGSRFIVEMPIGKG